MQQSIPEASLDRAIACQRGSVLDLSVVVDDARVELDHHIDRLRTAVRERDRAVLHLSRLIDLARCA